MRAARETSSNDSAGHDALSICVFPSQREFKVH